MSNAKQVLETGFGMPLVWLFNDEGTEILDLEGKPLNSYVVSFEYIYAEEEDDTCEIVLEFQNTQQMNLRYLRQNVVLIVQWGYMTPGSKVIPSPKRKVAIRDINTVYRDNKITMSIKCTDLVAYINGFKTNITPEYKDFSAETDIEVYKDSWDGFRDFIGENIRGEWQATITEGKNSVRIDKQGGVRAAEYNEKTGEYTIARDNTAVPRSTFIEFYTAKVINGRGQSIKNHIRNKLRMMDSVGNFSGPYIMDTTDDTIHMKQRNFLQRPFKNYTFGGGTGELLSFDVNTDTRKVKEKISTNTTVDPEEKLVDVTEIVAIDNEEAEAEELITTTVDIGGKARDIPLKRIDQELELYRRVFEHNVNNPTDQMELPDMQIRVTVKNTATKQDEGGFYQRAEESKNKKLPFEIITIPAKEVITLPYVSERLKLMRDESITTFVNSFEIVGQMVEKIQRKYEATLEVIGDPSLIKGKIYGIYGVSELDKGKWYATKVSHRMTPKNGYICTLDLLRKPATVTLSKKAAQIQFSKVGEQIRAENTFIEETQDIYKPDYEQEGPTVEDLSILNRGTPITREEQLSQMVDRLAAIDREEEYTLGKGENRRDSQWDINRGGYKENKQNAEYS